jgi:hypothetical protein
MIPLKKENIYPRTEANCAAVLKFYFSDYSLEEISTCSQEICKTYELEMNEIEFLVKNTSSNIEYITSEIRTHHNEKQKLNNIIKYGFQAIFVDEDKWNGSKNRTRITAALKQLIIKGNITVSIE